MSLRTQFLDRHPEYAATTDLDALRASEYGRLDAQGVVYLDYTGGGLHAHSQVREHADLLGQAVFGNPHSASPSSTAMTQAVERARAKVLDYFNATGEYTAVFTLNAHGALKLVGESYPFAPGGRAAADVRQPQFSQRHPRVRARQRGERRLRAADGAGLAHRPGGLTVASTQADRSRPNLFAFPAQSNFSGVKHPLALVDAAHDRGWDVLLDAAAFVPTNRLDLRVDRGRISSPSLSTRCSATRPVSAVC